MHCSEPSSDCVEPAATNSAKRTEPNSSRPLPCMHLTRGADAHPRGENAKRTEPNAGPFARCRPHFRPCGENAKRTEPNASRRSAGSPGRLTKQFGSAILRWAPDNSQTGGTWEPGQSLSPAALTPEGGIMSRHRGTALWLVFWGVVLGLALGLARLAPAQRTDRDASERPGGGRGGPRAPRHGAVPLAPGEEPPPRHGPGSRLRLSRRARHARRPDQVVPRPPRQGRARTAPPG